MTWINGLVPWLKSAYPRRLRIGSLVEIRLSTSSVVLYQNGKISDYVIAKFMGPLAKVVGVLTLLSTTDDVDKRIGSLVEIRLSTSSTDWFLG